MKQAAVLYATREGHTALIAECVARKLRDLGIPAVAVDLREQGAAVRLDEYRAVVLASSVHVGKHEPAMVRFVQEHRSSLEAMPSAFLSVSLSEAGVELPRTTPERRAQSAAGVQEMLDRFSLETGWRPAHVLPVAGALLYTKYNFFKRFVLKQISRRAGGSTDTSRDHVYTDWTALEGFIARFAQSYGLAVQGLAPRALT